MRNAATILAIHTRPTGEPCAVKAASTVREGAVGKGLVNSTSLAAYFARIGSGEWSFGGRDMITQGRKVDGLSYSQVHAESRLSPFSYPLSLIW